MAGVYDRGTLVTAPAGLTPAGTPDRQLSAAAKGRTLTVNVRAPEPADQSLMWPSCSAGDALTFRQATFRKRQQLAAHATR